MFTSNLVLIQPFTPTHLLLKHKNKISNGKNFHSRKQHFQIDLNDMVQNVVFIEWNEPFVEIFES